MNIENQPLLKFVGVDFPHLVFDLKKPMHGEHRVEASCSPVAIYDKRQPHTFRIVMEVIVSVENVMHLSLRAIGTFETSSDIDETTKEGFINSNSVAIMFPYVRAFISTLTANVGGINGSVVLPPQFFKGKLEILEPQISD